MGRKSKKVAVEGADDGEGAASSSNKSNKDDEDDNAEIGPEHGPRKMRQRGCTDCCCIIVAFVFGLGMAYISYLAWSYGEPYQILYGKDYLGNRCGRGDFKDRRKTVYPRLDQDLIDQSAIATTTPWRLNFYGICVAVCPDVTDPHVCLKSPESCIVRDYGTPEQWGAAGGSEYYFQVLPTLDLLNRCIPTRSVDSNQEPDRCAYPTCDNVTMECDPVIPELWRIRSSSDRKRCEVKFQETEVEQFATMTQSPLTEQLADKMAFLGTIVNALYASQTEILVLGTAAPVVLGLAWLVVLRLFAKTIVYLSIIAIGISLGLFTLYLFLVSGALDETLGELIGSSNLTSDGNATASADDAAAYNPVESAIVTLPSDELTELSDSLETQNPLLYQIAAWVCLVLTVIYLVVMCLSRRKIRIAAALVKEATVVIKDRPAALLFPFVILALQVPVVLYFLFFFIMLGTADLQLAYFVSSSDELLTASSSYLDVLDAMGVERSSGEQASGPDGTSAPAPSGNGGADLAPDPWWVPAAIFCYFLLGVLWTLETVRNTGWTALSGNVSDWYFFRRDAKMRSRTPLLGALCRVLRYHLGSVIFGSFVIAFIQLVRIVMQFIDKQTQKLQNANKVLKLALKCVQCCLWCFEKTVKFITNYCWIYVAMQGSGFCTSCFATFSLILSQPAQLSLNTLVRTVLTYIQLIGIPALCAWTCNMLLTSQDKPEPLYASSIVLLFSLIITMAFSLVMSCSLDTLFVCCVRDKAEYKGAFMSDRLYGAFGFDKTDRKERKAAKKAKKAEGSNDA